MAQRRVGHGRTPPAARRWTTVLIGGLLAALLGAVQAPAALAQPSAAGVAGPRQASESDAPERSPAGGGRTARVASLDGLAAALDSGASLVRAQYRAEGDPTATSVELDDGTSVEVSPGSGVPLASDDGIGEVVPADGFTTTTGAGTVSYVPPGVPVGTRCRAVYTDTGTASSRDGAARVVTAGC